MGPQRANRFCLTMVPISFAGSFRSGERNNGTVSLEFPLNFPNSRRGADTIFGDLSMKPDNSFVISRLYDRFRPAQKGENAQETALDSNRRQNIAESASVSSPAVQSGCPTTIRADTWRSPARGRLQFGPAFLVQRTTPDEWWSPPRPACPPPSSHGCRPGRPMSQRSSKSMKRRSK